MVILLIGLAAGASIACYDTGLFGPSVANLVAAFWANGVAANYNRHNAQEMPTWAATLGIITTAISIVLLIAGLATR